jgi:NAD(P)-dependent dehydrogenase (short-subunit alcohol dehydrogenase family)
MPSFDPSSLPDLSGKVFLVTGGNAGIGYETILHLVRKHATVYMGCRSTIKGRSAIASIQELVPKADIHLIVLDHMDLSSVISAAKDFASKQPKLHGLINNAGIMAVPFEKSKDGYESQWQTNYLSHFLLTQHLLPTLLSTARSSPPGDVRIVNVTSVGHSGFAPKSGIEFEDINQEKGGVWSRYGMSKLANVLHAKELNRLYGPNDVKKQEGEIWTAAVHPGNIYTDLAKNATYFGINSPVMAKMLNLLGAFIPAEKGAYTSVFCTASEQMKREGSGGYFVPLGKMAKPSKNAQDGELAAKLWKWTIDEFAKKEML